MELIVDIRVVHWDAQNSLQHTNIFPVLYCTGSLGQGIGRSSLTERLNNDKTVVFSLHGDGELELGMGVYLMENDHNWHGIAQLPETSGDYQAYYHA